MFYCGECAQARKWPVTGFTSSGRCEICGRQAACSDLPSTLLPDTRPDTSYQVSSYGRNGADTRLDLAYRRRGEAEQACRMLVRHDDREGAYIRRLPDQKIVYHFDRQDLDVG